MESGMAEVLLNRDVPLIDEVAESIKLSGGPSLASILDGLRDEGLAQGQGQTAAAILREIHQYRVQYEEPAAADLRRRKDKDEAAAVANKLSFGNGDGDENLNLVSALDTDFSGLGSCPRVSSLALRVSPEPDLCAAVAACHKFSSSGAFIAGAHHNIIVLYVGAYRPACAHAPGFYLVLDAYAKSLAAVPQLPASFVSVFSHRGIGLGAAVLRLRPSTSGSGSGSYLLAELVPRIGIGGLATSSASLCVWRRRNNQNQQQQQQSSSYSWEQRQVNLPQLPSPQHDFFADTTFAAGDDDMLCWVDLLMGVLVCKGVVLSDHHHPVFTFIPLPDGYYVRPDDPVHGRRRGIIPPERYRCMSPSVVNGGGDTIRFVSLDGYREGCAPGDVILTTWSLDLSDPESGWSKLQSFRIGDVVWSRSWTTTSPPTDGSGGSASPPSFFGASCPLLSAVNDGVVYLDMMQGPLPGYHMALRNGRVDKFTHAQSKPVAHKLVTSFPMFLNINKGH